MNGDGIWIHIPGIENYQESRSSMEQIVAQALHEYGIEYDGLVGSEPDTRVQHPGWEPYDPCPECGTEQEFAEVCETHGWSVVEDGEVIDFDWSLFDRHLTVECVDCGEVLYRTQKMLPEDTTTEWEELMGDGPEVL